MSKFFTTRESAQLKMDACASTLSDIQIRHALALAGLLGHTWAAIAPRGWKIDDVLPDAFKSIDAIESAVAQQCSEGPVGWGITSPSFYMVLSTQDIIIHHETATGRLNYTIQPDGSLSITINRPGGTCLNYSQTATGQCQLQCGDMSAEYRHYHALAECLIAINSIWQSSDGVPAMQSLSNLDVPQDVYNSLLACAKVIFDYRATEL